MKLSLKNNIFLLGQFVKAFNIFLGGV